MSFLTQASTYGPRGLPCISRARRQVSPLRQLTGGSLGSPWEGLPWLLANSSGPKRGWVLVPRSMASPGQHLRTGSARGLDSLMAEWGRTQGLSHGEGGCPLVVPFGMADVLGRFRRLAP